MDIFGILKLIGGLALFLFGMTTMGDGLAKMAGGRLEMILEKLTSKRIFAVLLGAGVTAVIQSSSATTVMVVGFVNSGIMQLSQAVGIIMGANVGTTVTSWILSLAGLEGSAWYIKMLKPSSFSPILAAVGIILMMTAKDNDKKKDTGNIFLGFAILMFGMETMSSAVSPLSSDPKFTSILTAFSMPILGLLAGAILTAIIQSSSASVGILQALCLTGSVTYATAIPIIMGQNIGTCVTSIISSVGASKNAKRASMIHLYFNLIGTALFMIIFYSINAFVHFEFLSKPASAAGIAVVHSLFNIVCATVFFPFADKLVKLATITIPDKKPSKKNGKANGNINVNANAEIAANIPTAALIPETKPESVVSLDERFLARPAFAMEVCRQETYKMAGEVEMAINMAMDLLTNYDNVRAAQVIAYEQRVDVYEDALDSYLVKLSAKDLSKKDSQTMSVLLHDITDLERISDHAINLQESALEIYEKKYEFSKSAKEELAVMIAAVRDIVSRAIHVFETEDLSAATSVEPLEEVIDRLEKEIKQRHIKRLRKGKCTVELGLVLEDILTVLERVSDHCSNIAVAMIEIHDDEFDTHAYIEGLNKGEGSKFYKECETFGNMYHLPEKHGKMKDENKGGKAEKNEAEKEITQNAEPENTESEYNKSGNTESGNTESGNTESENNKSENNKSENNKSGNNKSGNNKSGNNKSGNTESENNKSGNTELENT